MNIQKKQHNTLIIRELLPPPPISLCNNHISSNAFRSAIPALLHQAHAFCGRAFALMFIALPLAFASCEKDVMEELTPMHSMFNESVNLPQATLDSITNFTHKFGGYVGSHPESRQDKYFDPTLQNLRMLQPFTATPLRKQQLLLVSPSTTSGTEKPLFISKLGGVSHVQFSQ